MAEATKFLVNPSFTLMDNSDLLQREKIWLHRRPRRLAARWFLTPACSQRLCLVGIHYLSLSESCGVAFSLCSLWAPAAVGLHYGRFFISAASYSAEWQKSRRVLPGICHQCIIHWDWNNKHATGMNGKCRTRWNIQWHPLPLTVVVQQSSTQPQWLERKCDKARQRNGPVWI